jgi:acyl carrier protein
VLLPARFQRNACTCGFDVMNTQLTHLFADTFGIAQDRLLPDATLESLGLDSLAVIEFLFQIEDRFAIQIPDQANPPRTLGEMTALIEPLIAASPSAAQG